MKRGLTEKQLSKGLIRLEDTKEYLTDSIKNYLQYKKATKNWSSCCMSNNVNETLQGLYQELLEVRNDLSELQRKYL